MWRGESGRRGGVGGGVGWGEVGWGEGEGGALALHACLCLARVCRRLRGRAAGRGCLSHTRGARRSLGEEIIGRGTLAESF